MKHVAQDKEWHQSTEAQGSCVRVADPYVVHYTCFALCNFTPWCGCEKLRIPFCEVWRRRTAVGGRVMAHDRLAELRRGRELESPAGRGGGGKGGGHDDVEMGAGAFMQNFFDEAGDIKKTMASIRYNIRQIEQSHGECLTAVSADQGRESTERLEELMRTTNGMATQVRNRLKSMDVENKEYARSNVGASEARIRSNMHGTLTRKFVDLMAEYQELQTKYKNKYRERVERQYKIVKPHASKDEIDAAFDSGDSQDNVFTQQILQGPGHAAARSALADIQERHKDITRLETSIQELHQLFLDMSVLVESQVRGLPWIAPNRLGVPWSAIDWICCPSSSRRANCSTRSSIRCLSR